MDEERQALRVLLMERCRTKSCRGCYARVQCSAVLTFLFRVVHANFAGIFETASDRNRSIVPLVLLGYRRVSILVQTQTKRDDLHQSRPKRRPAYPLSCEDPRV